MKSQTHTNCTLLSYAHSFTFNFPWPVRTQLAPVLSSYLVIWLMHLSIYASIPVNSYPFNEGVSRGLASCSRIPTGKNSVDMGIEPSIFQPVSQTPSPCEHYPAPNLCMINLTFDYSIHVLFFLYLEHKVILQLCGNMTFAILAACSC